MGITVNLQTERGEVIDFVHDPQNVLHRILPQESDPSYIVLNYIDWYGDTTFNYIQMTPFLSEWSRVLVAAEGLGASSLHAKIESMARQCRDGSHLYLKFVGD